MYDFSMPNMTGTEATRALRLIGYRGVIVGVTGDAQVVDIERFMQAGANDVFIKPIVVEVVEVRLGAILARQQKRQSTV